MEWAKEQQLGDPAAKLVLVLLADWTGVGAGCCVYDDLFLAETGLTAEELDAALQHLAEAGLLTVEAPRWPSKRKKTGYDLRIPPGWGSRTSGPPPRRDGLCFDKPTAVYRLYDEANVLLYVGIATKPPTRFKRHAVTQPWWCDVATREIVWRDTRIDAQREEDVAIASEHPLYNLQHRSPDTRVIAPPRRGVAAGLR